MTENYKHMMGSFVLSEAFREDMEEKIANAAPAAPRRRPKALRIALIAAALCVLMAAGAAAAGMLTNSGEFTADAGTVTVWTSEGDVEGNYYQVEFDNSLRLSEEDITDNMRVLDEGHIIEFSTPEEAAEYLGLEILSNALLAQPCPQSSVDYEKAEAEGHSPAPTCFIGGSRNKEGEITRYIISSYYEKEEWRNVCVDLTISFFTPCAKVVSDGFTYIEGTPLADVYTAADGLTATIVQFPMGNRIDYCAYFSYNGAVYSLYVFPNGGGVNLMTRGILIEILEAFEFEQ